MAATMLAPPAAQGLAARASEVSIATLKQV